MPDEPPARGNGSMATVARGAVAVGVALFAPWLACALYVVVALVWLVPDQRIERLLS